MKLGILTALSFEADVFGPGSRDPATFRLSENDRLVFLSGMGPERTEEGVRQLADAGAEQLLGFGVATGLDPALRPGDCLVPRTILQNGREQPAPDPALADGISVLLAEGAPNFRIDARPLAAVARIMATPPDKARLFKSTGAVAADMESGALARAAHARGLPYAVLRTVLDPAGTRIPAFVTDTCTPTGVVRPFPLMRALLRNPGTCAALFRLARYQRTARASLRHAAGRLAANEPRTTPRK